MFDFLLPVIQLSTDVNKEPHVYLCEDGLDLWLNTLYCTNTLTPDLLNLYANMPHLLGMCNVVTDNCYSHFALFEQNTRFLKILNCH